MANENHENIITLLYNKSSPLACLITPSNICSCILESLKQGCILQRSQVNFDEKSTGAIINNDDILL